MRKDKKRKWLVVGGGYAPPYAMEPLSMLTVDVVIRIEM